MIFELEGDNLGAKHKQINELVSESLKNENIVPENVDLTKSDIDNIIKIDIASKNQNVDYIIKVLKCEDMLYVSRAIKQCPWLITESKYEHIINPKYLYEVLYPQMTTKAAIKLTKHIKLYLKDCQRVEQFYTYEEDALKAADWLPHCSTDFIISNFKKHIDHIDITLLKRLCERTIEVLEVFMDKCDRFHVRQKAAQATIFLLKIDLNKYLNIVEKVSDYIFPKFNRSSTEIIMKQEPSRIMNNFQKYYNHIHIGTFLKYLKKENIKSFLFNLFKEKNTCPRNYISFQTLTRFLTAMPDADRFETVKQVLIDKVHLIDDDNLLPKPLKSTMNNLYNFTCTCRPRFIYDHYWYRFTPFEFALTEIKKIINNQTSPAELKSMFDTLIIAASGSMINLTTLIEYFKNYSHVDKTLRESFIKKILSENNLHDFDEGVWEKIKNTFMDDIVTDINDPNYSAEYIQICVEAIIIYETLHMRKIPDVVQCRFKFNSLKYLKTKMMQGDGDKIFIYLYNTIMKKLNSHASSTKEEFLEKIELLNEALDLLIDWDKEIGNYPAVLNAIRDLIKINELNSWKADFSKIYNKKKSWRKVLFEDSLRMCPNQPVFMNILKHDPTLFERSTNDLERVIFDKNMPLQQYHKKVKIYWSESRSKELLLAYKEQLKRGNCNKAVIRALCTLLPKTDFTDILIQNSPKEEKINWDKIDNFTLTLQQNLALTMHIARPQPAPKIIIDYSKGDYLPYALPSLYSIFNNLTLAQSQEFIPILLDSRVSLQKHGIRLAFIKLLPEDVKNLLSVVLQSNKNLTIRHVAFTLTYKLLCKEKDHNKIQTIWAIMEGFLDDLTYNENKAIYDLLSKVKELPTVVQPKYLMKAYVFLKGLIASSPEYKKYKYSVDSLIEYARKIVNQLCPKFVENILLEYIDNELISVDKYYADKLELLSSFLLSSDTKESQIEKCNNIVIPLLHKCYTHWDDIDKDKAYYVRSRLNGFLACLKKDTKDFVSTHNKEMPTELFKIIQIEFMKNRDISNSYLSVTTWQISVTLVVNFDLYKQDGDDWDKTCLRLLSPFSEACKTYLKDHCENTFFNIYILFAKALNTCLKCFFSDDNIFEFLKTMLNNETSIAVHLVVLQLIRLRNGHHSDKGLNNVKELFTEISNHPSPEVQIHYYQCRNVYLTNISETIICQNMKQKYAAITTAQ